MACTLYPERVPSGCTSPTRVGPRPRPREQTRLRMFIVRVRPGEQLPRVPSTCSRTRSNERDPPSSRSSRTPEEPSRETEGCRSGPRGGAGVPEGAPAALWGGRAPQPGSWSAPDIGLRARTARRGPGADNAEEGGTRRKEVPAEPGALRGRPFTLASPRAPSLPPRPRPPLQAAAGEGPALFA